MVNAVWVSVPHGGEGMVGGTVYFGDCRSKKLLVHTSEDQTELGQEVECQCINLEACLLKEPLLPASPCLSKGLLSLKMIPLGGWPSV